MTQRDLLRDAERIVWTVLEIVFLAFWTLVAILCVATVIVGALGLLFGIGPAGS